MRKFGSEEYGNQNGFKVICQNCGKEADVVPIHHFEGKLGGNLEKITLEIRCSCGNKYGATIHSD